MIQSQGGTPFFRRPRVSARYWHVGCMYNTRSINKRRHNFTIQFRFHSSSVFISNGTATVLFSEIQSMMSSKQKFSEVNDSYDLELFFELSADLFCIAGFDGYFKRVNPAVSKLLEYTKEELLSRPINEFIHEDDKSITSSYREKIIQGVPLLNFENRYVSKTGKIVWLSWTSMPSEDQKIVYAIAKNITYKKSMERNRNVHLSTLTKINSNLKHFSFTASHDIRSPAGSLITAIDLLDENRIQDKETLNLIRILKKGAENLKNTLTNQIDVLKKNEIIDIEIEELDLEESLSEVTQSIDMLIQDSRAVIESNFTNMRTIRFNKIYLTSIFLNLITNSVKYARPQIPPSIFIHSREVDGIKQLVFSDNGLGFDMEKQKHKIFRFNQTFHNQEDSKGIGLYLVYSHVISLGGSIAVESEPNKGATFIISLPPES